MIYNKDRDPWLSDIVKPQLGEVKVAVEIGVWKCGYSSQIYRRLAPKTIYGIDPYAIFDVDLPDARLSSSLMEKHYNFAKRVFSKMGGDIIRKKSLEAVDDFDDGSLDFVYIDGDHSYESVSKECPAWWSKVRSGGILSGHDYIEGNAQKGHVYGVIPAVNEFADKINQEVNLTNCPNRYLTWWFIKP